MSQGELPSDEEFDEEELDDEEYEDDDEEEEGDDPPPKKRRRLRRLAPQSAPGWAGCITWIFLLVVVITIWTLFFRDPNNVPWRHSVGWGRILLVCSLVFIIPYLLYRTLRLWLEPEKSLFPDINYAWNAGLEALEEHGLSIEELPVFLVLGSHHYEHEQAIASAARLELRVFGEPEGPAPLHWYANPEAIYIFCTDASALSALAAKRQKQFEEQRSNPLRNPPPPTPEAAPAPSPEELSPRHRGTIEVDRFFEAEGTLSPDSTPPPGLDPSAAGAPAQVRGTLALDQPVNLDSSQSSIATGQESFGGYGNDESFMQDDLEDLPVELNSSEVSEQLRKLQYVCQLLLQVRSPVCPINGILTMLPYGAIQAGEEDAEALQQAVKGDLMTIHFMLKLRCPVTAMVVDMERERGFQELVRRVGREGALNQRFGRKYDVRSLATPEEMHALSFHVSGAFEDWVYSLFRQEGSLSRRGNRQLYNLLCKVRAIFQIRLADVLAGGFGYDPALVTEEDSLLFSGCYFAATGKRVDRQAFVKGVFDKLQDEQEWVEWTTEALDRDRRWERFAAAGMLVSVILAGVIAAMWWFF